MILSWRPTSATVAYRYAAVREHFDTGSAERCGSGHGAGETALCSSPLTRRRGDQTLQLSPDTARVTPLREARFWSHWTSGLARISQEGAWATWAMGRWQLHGIGATRILGERIWHAQVGVVPGGSRRLPAVTGRHSLLSPCHSLLSPCSFSHDILHCCTWGCFGERERALAIGSGRSHWPNLCRCADLYSWCGHRVLTCSSVYVMYVVCVGTRWVACPCVSRLCWLLTQLAC